MSLTRIAPLTQRCFIGGGETLVDIARSYNVSHPTISRLRG
jgi:hypothetical protein